MPKKPTKKKGPTVAKPTTKPVAKQRTADDYIPVRQRRGYYGKVRSNPDQANREASNPVADGATNAQATTGLASKLNRTTDNSSHVIVRALAGTGKTTTLVEGLRHVQGGESNLRPSPQQAMVWEAMKLSTGHVRTIGFVAFNKSIAEELQRRVPAGCDAMTMHSLGFKAVRAAFSKCKVNSYRVQDILSELMEQDIREIRSNKPNLVNAIEQLVGLAKQNLSSLDDIDDNGILDPNGESIPVGDPVWREVLSGLAGYYDVDLNGDAERIYDLVPRVLERCKDVNRDGCIDFNDMIWLPVILKLPVMQYDLLLVDEAQDLNKCQQQLALKAGRRLILCGDEKQAIYGFAGADCDSMPNMFKVLEATERGCVQLPLTVTRRCGKAIVAEAQKIVPEFEAFEENGEGLISSAMYPTENSSPAEDYRGVVQDGDMIVCRVNAPLVSNVFKFLKAGRKAYIQGRDIGQGLIRTIDKLKASNITELVGKLSDWYHAESMKESAKRTPSEAKLIALRDRYDCLSVFIDEATTIDQVKERIEKIFQDKETTGIRLSSVHRAKGLEAGRVFILLPEGASMPHPLAKTAWQRGQEENLRYVAITRAIKELVYVTQS